MDFSDALKMMKLGHCMARSGWNGRGMFVYLVPGSIFKVSRQPLISILGAGREVEYLPHIDMKTADGKLVPWLISQTDVMAEDWEEVYP